MLVSIRGRSMGAATAFRFSWGVEPRVGDVVLAWRSSASGGGFLQAHRIVGRRAQQWLTMGDACWRLDPPLSEAAVLAVATDERSQIRAWWGRVRCAVRLWVKKASQ